MMEKKKTIIITPKKKSSENRTKQLLDDYIHQLSRIESLEQEFQSRSKQYIVDKINQWWEPIIFFYGGKKGFPLDDKTYKNLNKLYELITIDYIAEFPNSESKTRTDEIVDAFFLLPIALAFVNKVKTFEYGKAIGHIIKERLDNKKKSLSNVEKEQSKRGKKPKYCDEKDFYNAILTAKGKNPDLDLSNKTQLAKAIGFKNSNGLYNLLNKGWHIPKA